MLQNFSYRYLVRGYTPAIQSTRSCPIFPIPIVNDMNALFQTLNGIVITEKRSRCFSQISYKTKTQYQQGWKDRVGLEPHINLSISPIVTSVGKWEENGENSILSFVYEISLKKAKHSSMSNFLVEYFSNDINALPDHDGWLAWIMSWVGVAISNEKLDLFFDKWGTHFISRVMIGGSIRVDVRVDSDDDKNRIRDKINQQLNSLATGKHMATRPSILTHQSHLVVVAHLK